MFPSSVQQRYYKCQTFRTYDKIYDFKVYCCRRFPRKGSEFTRCLHRRSVRPLFLLFACLIQNLKLSSLIPQHQYDEKKNILLPSLLSDFSEKKWAGLSYTQLFSRRRRFSHFIHLNLKLYSFPRSYTCEDY